MLSNVSFRVAGVASKGERRRLLVVVVSAVHFYV